MSDKTKEIDLTVLATVLIAPVAALLLLPILLWSGWAASILWGWFAVPAFGLPPLSITNAAGICLLISVARVKLSAPKDSLSFGQKVFAVVFGPPFAVGMGWLVKWIAL